MAPILVVYRDRTVFVSNPTDFPDLSDATSKVVEVQESIVNASIIVPEGDFICFLLERLSLKIKTFF